MKKGTNHSEATKKRISESLKGHTNSTSISMQKMVETKMLKGNLKHSGATKRKMSISHKNLSPEKRAKIIKGIREKRYTPEYAKKLSDTKLGVLNPTAKVTEEDVRHIKRLFETGNYSTTALADRFPISRQSVADIVYGRTWKHIK